MTKIIIARHGEYGNPDHIVPFRSNEVTLTQKGRGDIKSNAEKLIKENISQIYSSPIKRCVETAEIYSQIMKVGFNIDEDLIEIGSPLQNTPEPEYWKLTGDKSVYANQYHLSHGGESYQAVVERMERILRKVLKENESQTTLLVSHGDPIMILLSIATGSEINIEEKLDSQTNYIPKAGLIEMIFDKEKFVSFKNLNFQ